MSRSRANGEGSIRQRPDGRWEVRITKEIDFATGKPKRISRYTDTQEEAINLLHELSFIYDTHPHTFDNIKLGEWLDLCLELYMKNSLKQSTYISYEGYIRNHIKPAIGDVYLKDLSPRMLQLFYNYKNETEGLAPKTIVNINLFLHKALSYAEKEGYILSNPAEAINLPRGDKPQIEILTRDEQNILIKASYNHRYGVFIRLVLFTGLRLGELLGLRWEDVDFKGSLLNVKRTLNRLNRNKKDIKPGELTTEIVIQTPKSENSIRSIPLLPAVLNDIMEWKRVQENEAVLNGDNYYNSGYIVTNELGGYVEPRTFRDYYNQILGIANLRHFTFHALRHTFASRAMEQGMDAKTLSIILGHYSVSFTLDTYTHVLNEQKHESMALLADLYQTGSDFDKPNLYPIIITNNPNGSICFESPDFKDVSFVGMDFNLGVQYMKEMLSEEVLTSQYLPEPTRLENMTLSNGQMVLQVMV